MLGLLGVAALETTLRRDPGEPTHPRLSPALKVAVAAVIGTLGLLDLGWRTHPLFVLVLGGLAVPMAYGAYVWFGDREAEEAAVVSDR